MNVQNPHDIYFKSVFSYIDLHSITIENNSYVDKKLTEYFSDLNISCLINDCKTKIYILVEHKSYYDKYTLLQMLKYMLEIWIKDSKDKNNKYLKPIIPILFYQNK